MDGLNHDASMIGKTERSGLPDGCSVPLCGSACGLQPITASLMFASADDKGRRRVARPSGLNGAQYRDSLSSRPQDIRCSESN